MRLQQAPNEIQPAPAPATVKVGVGTDADGRAWVMMAFATTIGENTFFLEPDMADWIRAQLEAKASEARTGIVRPQMIVPPDASANGHGQKD